MTDKVEIYIINAQTEEVFDSFLVRVDGVRRVNDACGVVKAHIQKKFKHKYEDEKEFA